MEIDTRASAAQKPARRGLSDISGPWFPWEVSKDCEEESPNNELGVREPYLPLPQLNLHALQPLALSTNNARRPPTAPSSVEPQPQCTCPAPTGVQPLTLTTKRGSAPPSPAPTGV